MFDDVIGQSIVVIYVKVMYLCISMYNYCHVRVPMGKTITYSNRMCCLVVNTAILAYRPNEEHPLSLVFMCM